MHFLSSVEVRDKSDQNNSTVLPWMRSRSRFQGESPSRNPSRASLGGPAGPSKWPFRSQSIDRSSVRRSIHIYEENCQHERESLSRSTSTQQLWSTPSSSSLMGSTNSLVKTAYIRKIEDMDDPMGGPFGGGASGASSYSRGNSTRLSLNDVTNVRSAPTRISPSPSR